MGYGGVRRKSKKDIRAINRALNSIYMPRGPRTRISREKLIEPYIKAVRNVHQTLDTRASQPKRKGGRRK